MRIPFLITTLAALPLPSLAAEWCSLDSSVLSFATTFEGETLPGEFRDFDVVLDFDPAAPGAGNLRVQVDLRSADMGDPDMNAILADPAWFHSGKFGEAVFRSERIGAAESGGFVAGGTLSLKGRELPVSVPFYWQGSAGDAALQGEFVLRRTDFDVGSGEWADGDAIGIDVRLNFDVHLRHCE
jgi:polyisoprenoid-binding protein YceI